MALTLREMIDLTQKQYRLQLLAGSSYLEHVVTWVHMLEFTNVTEFFWGNELVVTSGYALQREEEMFHLIDTLEERHCTGLVINVGKYIHKVSDTMISYCEEKSLPLLIMPWDMYLTEFVRDCCSLINQSSRDEELLAQTVLQVVQSPQLAEVHREQLEDYFHEQNGFRMIAIRAERGKQMTAGLISDQRRVLRLHTALRTFQFSYLVFRYEKRFVVVLNEKSKEAAEKAVRRIHRAIRTVFSEAPVYIGISDPADTYEELSACFHGAISASRRAGLQEQDVVWFHDMGFYKLLYSVPDDTLLLDYYHEIMDPLLLHDRLNQSAYVETLFRYLLYDGSLQEVAARMFTHRNTVNYRMGKIREILGCSLASQRERLPYLVCYHIGVMLKLVKNLEEG